MFTFKKIALLGAAGLAAFAMSCSDDDGDDAPPPSTDPIRTANLTLSNATNSYGDVDAATGYSRSGGTLTAATAVDVDVIAFAGSSITASNSKIYTPGGAGEVAVGTSDDIFWDLHEAAADASKSPYAINICTIPSATATLIKEAVTYGDLSEWLTSSAGESFLAGCDDDGSVDLANDAAFMVLTSKGKFVAAVPSAVSTSSVTLKLYYIN